MATITSDQLLEAFEQMTVLELSEFKFEDELSRHRRRARRGRRCRRGRRWRRRPGRRGARGADRVHRDPDRDRPQQDPGHQGRSSSLGLASRRPRTSSTPPPRPSRRASRRTRPRRSRRPSRSRAARSIQKVQAAVRQPRAGPRHDGWAGFLIPGPPMTDPPLFAEASPVRASSSPVARRGWMAAHDTRHRVPSHGTDMLGQRYALDLLSVRSPPGRPLPPDRAACGATALRRPRRATSPRWGEPIHAPLDGEVVTAVRRRWPSASGSMPARGCLLPFRNGVHVHGRRGAGAVGRRQPSCFATPMSIAGFAHLAPGTVARSREGRWCRDGDLLGRVGTRAARTAPHLPPLMDGPDLIVAQGRPVRVPLLRGGGRGHLAARRGGDPACQPARPLGRSGPARVGRSPTDVPGEPTPTHPPGGSHNSNRLCAWAGSAEMAPSRAETWSGCPLGEHRAPTHRAATHRAPDEAGTDLASTGRGHRRPPGRASGVPRRGALRKKGACSPRARRYSVRPIRAVAAVGQPPLPVALS